MWIFISQTGEKNSERIDTGRYRTGTVIIQLHAHPLILGLTQVDIFLQIRHSCASLSLSLPPKKNPADATEKHIEADKQTLPCSGCTVHSPEPCSSHTRRTSASGSDVSHFSSSCQQRTKWLWNRYKKEREKKEQNGASLADLSGSLHLAGKHIFKHLPKHTKYNLISIFYKRIQAVDKAS